MPRTRSVDPYLDHIDSLNTVNSVGVPRPRPSISVLSPNHPANQGQRKDSRNSVTYQVRVPAYKFSLGWELEANRCATRVPVGVDQIKDSSVNGDSAEYVVLPSVTKAPTFVLGLLKDLVHAPKLNTDKSCGFHIHVGMQGAKIATLKQWAIATESLALDIEDLAFKAVPTARHANQYCRRIVPLQAGTRFVPFKSNNERRYHWLNTVEIFRPGGIRTIEIRLLGNTHRWKYLLAWTAFSLSLAREGWKLAHKPFDSRKESISQLSDLLKAIASDIRPLEKRYEPVPTWLYSQLKNLGIEFSAFDRPLKTLTKMESRIKGCYVVPYSDDQRDVPNVNEDEDYCACGCGTEGRCDSQMHDDGDCESNSCYNCHENGDCNSRCCENCRESAHSDGELCSWNDCRRCDQIRAEQEGEEEAASVPVIFSDLEMNRRAGLTCDTHETALSAERDHRIRQVLNSPDLSIDDVLQMQRAAESRLTEDENTMSLDRSSFRGGH